MAKHEGSRMDAQFMVICKCPDVCKTPSGPALVPVPYQIVAYMNNSILVSPNVRSGGKPVFHMGSRVATVVGDEAGVAGGVASQVIKGMCRPVVPIPTVKFNGQMGTHHQKTLMLMNCAGPNGSANTIGTVKFNGLMSNADVGPGGSIPADANDLPKAETAAEQGMLSKLTDMAGGDIVGMAQKAYGLATTDWSNPAAALGAISGVAGMAGMGSLAKAAGTAAGVAGLATADWSNPGAALAGAMGIAGPLLGGGGGSAPQPNSLSFDVPPSRAGEPKFPPGIVPYSRS